MKHFIRSCFALAVVVLLSEIAVRAQEPLPKKPDAGERQRIGYELTRSVDPATGELPDAIKQREYDFVSKLPAYNSHVAYKGNTVLGMDWLPVGPTDQPGRARAFAIDITNAQNFIVASASGGVWRSIDRGASWVKVTPVNEVQSISSIVQDKRAGKASVWYYGTSELLSTTNRRQTTNIRTHSYGNGIYRSLDNGTTWTPLASTQTRSGNVAPVQFQGVWNLALDHRNAAEDIMYAACYGGIMRSSDGGTSWTLVLGSDTNYCFNSDIVIGTNGTLYAALGSAFNGTPSPKQGIWKSSDGINWEKINDVKMPVLCRRIKLAVAPSTDSLLYAFIEYPDFWSDPDATFNSNTTILKYSGLNNAWTRYTTPATQDYSLTLAGYAMTLTVSPTDPDVVFFGGTDIYRSNNGMQTYQWIAGYVDEEVEGPIHPDVHGIVFDPHDPNILFAATDGGIYSTSEPMATQPYWDTYHSGLETSQIYDVKLDNEASGDGFLVCGLQDNNSYATLDATLGWELTSGGDGMTCGSILGSRFFTTSAQSGYIGFFGYDQSDVLNYYGYGYPTNSVGLFTFFTRYLIDPSSRDALFLPEGNRLWRLDNLQYILSGSGVDNDNGWTLYTNVEQAIGSSYVITALASTPSIDPKLYLGSNNGKIYRLEMGSESAIPMDISNVSFPQYAYLSHIEIDPDDESHMIVVFSNYNILSIFRTTNGGNSWNAISGNLEEHPDGTGAGPSVRCVKMLHTQNGIVYYAATTSGLFSTNAIDGMNTEWIREGVTTIGNLLVENLDARNSDGKVVCATQGGGVFANFNNMAVQNGDGNADLFVEQNYPNPVRTTSDIHFRLNTPLQLTIELFDVRGAKLATLGNDNYSAGEHSYKLSAPALGLTEGTYFYRITGRNQAITKVLTVIK